MDAELRNALNVIKKNCNDTQNCMKCSLYDEDIDDCMLNYSNPCDWEVEE